MSPIDRDAWWPLNGSILGTTSWNFYCSNPSCWNRDLSTLTLTFDPLRPKLWLWITSAYTLSFRVFKLCWIHFFELYAVDPFFFEFEEFEFLAFLDPIWINCLSILFSYFNVYEENLYNVWSVNELYYFVWNIGWFCNMNGKVSCIYPSSNDIVWH